MKKQKIEFSGVAHFSPSRTTTKNKALLFFFFLTQNKIPMGVDFFLKKKTNKFFRKIIFVTQMSNFSLFIFFLPNRESMLTIKGGDAAWRSAVERKESTGQETFPSVQRRFLL